MKIKGLIITGSIFVILGAGACVYASTRDDFSIEKVYTDPESHLVQYTQEEAIKKIQYDGRIESITIQTAETDTISCEYYEGKYKTYEVGYDSESETLNIQQKISHWYNFIFDFSLLGDMFNNRNSLVLTIPQSIDLDAINISLNAGTISISELSSSTIDCKINAGTIDVKKVEVETATLESNAGEVHLEDLTANQVSCTTKAGDIQATKVKINQFSGHVNAGSIYYNGEIYESFGGVVSAGNCEVRLHQKEALFKVNGKGNGAITVDFSIGAGSGSVHFEE